jgi:signal transduction histidine kinase
LALPWVTGQQRDLGLLGEDCKGRRLAPPPPAAPAAAAAPASAPAGLLPAPTPESYIACFSPRGEFIGATFMPADMPRTITIPQPFLGPQLVARTLASGSAWDIIDAGPEFGPMLRGAITVRAQRSGELLGVLQVGMKLPEVLRSLQLIRNVMLVVGIIAFGMTCAGGWLLAARALSPARLAIARQQAFISDASHELRAPLALLRANAEVLLRERDQFSVDHGAMLEDIVGEVEQLSRLATDLFTLAELDAGRLALDRAVVDLDHVAATLARRIGALAAEKGVSIRRQPAPGALTLGDQRYIEQAALALLENAVQFTPTGGTVTLSAAAVDGRVSLVVEDTGVGIPPQHIGRLGERFFRGDASRNRSTGGSGLGLAIAFHIAAAHGGNVKIESTVGQYTRAALTLPAAAN